VRQLAKETGRLASAAKGAGRDAGVTVRAEQNTLRVAVVWQQRLSLSSPRRSAAESLWWLQG